MKKTTCYTVEYPKSFKCSLFFKLETFWDIFPNLSNFRASILESFGDTIQGSIQYRLYCIEYILIGSLILFTPFRQYQQSIQKLSIKIRIYLESEDEEEMDEEFLDEDNEDDD